MTKKYESIFPQYQFPSISFSKCWYWNVTINIIHWEGGQYDDNDFACKVSTKMIIYNMNIFTQLIFQAFRHVSVWYMIYKKCFLSNSSPKSRLQSVKRRRITRATTQGGTKPIFWDGRDGEIRLMKIHYECSFFERDETVWFLCPRRNLTPKNWARPRVSVSFLQDRDENQLFMKKKNVYLARFCSKLIIQIRTRPRRDWV